MNRKIRIGIDCDGVLRDFIGKTIELSRKKDIYFGRPTNLDYIDNVLIEGKTIRQKIWEDQEWLEEVFAEADTLPFAEKGYEAFIEDDNFEVYIVTSQFEGTEYLTDRWLKNNGFDKHEKTYFLFDKLEAPCQIIIDDKPPHIQDYRKKGREAYLVGASHNMDHDDHNKVDNLYHAYELIKERHKEESYESKTV